MKYLLNRIGAKMNMSNRNSNVIFDIGIQDNDK